jgi:hypothetical protein
VQVPFGFMARDRILAASGVITGIASMDPLGLAFELH